MNLFRNIFNRYKQSKLKYRISIPIVLVLFVWYVFCLPSPLFDVSYSTTVTDRSGQLLGARIADDQQWRFPITDSIPEKYKTCVVAFEDQYFRYHWGINPVSIFRAIKQNVAKKKITSGASTITMQTIRMARGEKRTYGEKFIEMILATRLEFSYSKDEILELYASHAPMGGNVVGIDAASWRYFGHEASTLSWAEAATLAVLPNSPAAMHFGRNRDLLLNKRNRLLKKLLDQETLNQTDYELAISEPLPFQPHPLPQIAPHLVTKIYLEQPNKRVHSTIDRGLQLQTEAILRRWNAQFIQNDIKNLAAVVIDAQTNEVLVYSGNIDFYNTASANQVDIIQSPRSTGSILKPFLYCAMLQDGALLPDQLLADIPLNVHGYTPKNYSLKYDGAVPASEALARSLNIPSVISLRDYSVPKFYTLLKQAGMTTLNRSSDHYGLSLILGGAEGKLWDITSIYTKMVQSLNDYNSEGEYYDRPQPTYIFNEKKDDDLPTNPDPLFKAGAVWQTLEALTNVNRPEEIDWRSIPSMRKIAWKTGTSFGFRDGWAVGANSRYVVGVWVGNSDGEGRPDLVGARTAGFVMFDIFNTLPATKWFARPTSDLVVAEICHRSGCLKGLNCPANEIDSVYISPKGVNGKVCNFHEIIHLSEDGQYQVYEDCAGKRGIVHTPWFVLPPSWEAFYREHHPDYRAKPPYSPECIDNRQSKTMEFIYPFWGAVINLPKQLDGSEGRVVFELAHSRPETKVFWHLDEQYIGETRDIHKKEYSPSKGIHRLTVVDELGNTTSIKFEIR